MNITGGPAQQHTQNYKYPQIPDDKPTNSPRLSTVHSLLPIEDKIHSHISLVIVLHVDVYIMLQCKNTIFKAFGSNGFLAFSSQVEVQH